MLVFVYKEDEPELPAVTPIKKNKYKSTSGSSGKTKHTNKPNEDEPSEGNVSGKRYQFFSLFT